MEGRTRREGQGHVVRTPIEVVSEYSTRPARVFADLMRWPRLYTGSAGMTLRDVSLAELGRRCREETLRFLRGEPRDDAYCFEVFERAVARPRDAALAALLKYLKLCVHSVLMDDVRARRAVPVNSLEEVPETVPATATTAEQRVVGKLASEQLWATIAAELQDEAEQVVAYLSFARELKPSEIFGRHPRLYASVADVYRIKRNLIEPLRRSPQVRAFLEV